MPRLGRAPTGGLDARDLEHASLVYFTILLGANLWFTTVHVRAVGHLGFSNLELSLLFSVGNVPGFLVILLSKLAGRASLHAAMGGLCAIAAVALVLVSRSDSWPLVASGVFLLSLAQVFVLPVVSASRMERYDDRASAQRSLAQLRSYGPLAALCASALIVTVLPRLDYELLFGLVAVASLMVAVRSFLLGRRVAEIERVREISFIGRLWPYYLMNFLSGARSALFKAFVITMLVREHGFDLRRTAMLVFAGTIAGFVGYRVLGLVARRIEPRHVIGGSYVVVGMLFLGFATVESPAVLAVLYIVDSTIFGVSVVTDSVLRSLVAPKDIACQLGIGLAIFYAAGIALPALGAMVAGVTGDFDLVFVFAALVAWCAALVSRILCRRAAMVTSAP